MHFRHIKVCVDLFCCFILIYFLFSIIDCPVFGSLKSLLCTKVAEAGGRMVWQNGVTGGIGMVYRYTFLLVKHCELANWLFGL